ncbi:MAG: VWA domain-containing protein [Candidatus Competibacteraceae bacterium]|nr:VWA domain-containing protein [Candidatus Competibacteraceae bacterium]
MFQFAWPWLLAALPLPLLALLIPPASHPPLAALRVPFFHRIDGVVATPRPRSRLVLALFIWLLLVTAAARPQWVGEPLELPLTGRDLLLAIDISQSMEIRDMVLDGERTDRLSAVKAVAGRFIARREGDRLGLILFGRNAYLQVPLTFDRETVRVLLNEAEPGLAGRETALGDAIALGVKRLRERPEQGRVLVLLTDGVSNAGRLEPLKAAELAAASAVRIHTIGVGADKLIIRDFFGSRSVNPSQDLDEETLQQIAFLTGGEYFRARDTQALASIYALLDELEPAAREQETFRPVAELYPWPLGTALGLSVLTALTLLVPLRRNPVSA